jgi:MoxR-like ATPase
MQHTPEYKYTISEEKAKTIGLKPYFPSKALSDAIDMAIALNRPLLLKGEPGCGKTRVAEVVAQAIHGEAYKDFYFEWNIKSTSKANDGIYTFDHIARLRDATIDGAKTTQLSSNLSRYIKKGALAGAIEKSNETECSILLIDEIDKADIDFPNDLLMELDKKEYKILELKKNNIIKPKGNVLIIITSNDEKELPPAFLRRCLFHYVEFPNDVDLQRIVKANFPKMEETLMNKAIEKFIALKKDMDSRAEKTISTSELLDWITLIEHFKIGITDLEIKAEAKENHLPLFQALLKTKSDADNFKKIS